MTETKHSAPLVRNSHDATSRWFYGGGVHTWLASAAETGGAFLLFADEMDRGKCTPLHTHPADETMYVVDGTVLMHLDGKEYDVAPGGIAFAPRGVPHAFLVTSGSARVLWLHTPATCEAFYLAASEPLTASTERVVDFDRVRAAAEDVGGIEILGPPPFAAA